MEAVRECEWDLELLEYVVNRSSLRSRVNQDFFINKLLTLRLHMHLYNSYRYGAEMRGLDDLILGLANEHT